MIWIILALFLISNSASHFPRHFVNASGVLTTIDNDCLYPQFLNSLTWLRYLSIFSLCFGFDMSIVETVKSTVWRFFFLFTTTGSNILVWTRLYVWPRGRLSIEYTALEIFFPALQIATPIPKNKKQKQKYYSHILK